MSPGKFPHGLSHLPARRAQRRLLPRRPAGYDAVKVVSIPYAITSRPAAPSTRPATPWRRRAPRWARTSPSWWISHGRPAPLSLARWVLRALEPGRPLFAGEPAPPEQMEKCAGLIRILRVTIAAGVRLIGRAAFEEAIRRRAFHIARPDIVHVGGLREAKKCESAGVGIARHNPLGPIAGIAAPRFGLSTPIHVIREEMVGAVPEYDDVVKWPIESNPRTLGAAREAGALGQRGRDRLPSVRAGSASYPQRGAARRRHRGLVNAMPGRLQDKVAIATGAAIAHSFAAEGAQVVLSERNPDTGQAVVDETGGLFVRTDVAEQTQVEAVATATLERLGRIEVKFNADLTIARSPTSTPAPGSSATERAARVDGAARTPIHTQQRKAGHDHSVSTHEGPDHAFRSREGAHRHLARRARRSGPGPRGRERGGEVHQAAPSQRGPSRPPLAASRSKAGRSASASRARPMRRVSG